LIVVCLAADQHKMTSNRLISKGLLGSGSRGGRDGRRQRKQGGRDGRRQGGGRDGRRQREQGEP